MNQSLHMSNFPHVAIRAIMTCDEDVLITYFTYIVICLFTYLPRLQPKLLQGWAYYPSSLYPWHPGRESGER